MNEESLTADELLEHLGHILHDVQYAEPGGPLYARKVDFTRLARAWIVEHYEAIRKAICKSDYRKVLNHPANDLLMFIIGLLQAHFPSAIAIPLAYYICKVGVHQLCTQEVDELLRTKR